MKLAGYIPLAFMVISCSQIHEPAHTGSVPSVPVIMEKQDFKAELSKTVRTGQTGTLWDYEARLAVLYAKSNQLDSAFYYVRHYVDSDSSDNVFYEPGFYNLLSDPRWKAIEQKQFEKSLRQGRKHKDRDITLQLWRMHITDQAFYADLQYYNQRYGHGNPMWETLVNRMEIMNKENLARLIPILNTVTWPKISEYDSLAAATAFLIIQHSNDSLQAKYLPIIEGYCKAGEASWQSFCLMEDRLLVNKGKPQIYGTQLYIKNNRCLVREIKDSINVDKRRKEKGLMPLNEYLNYSIR